MPKNIFTLSVFALPVYTIVLYLFGAAVRRVLSPEMRRSIRIGLSLLLPFLTLHALPLIALAIIYTTIGLPSGNEGHTGTFLVTYCWISSLIIAGQTFVYYVPFYIIGKIPFRSRRIRLRDYATPRSRALAMVLLIVGISVYTTYRTMHDALSVTSDTITLPVLSPNNPVDSYTIATIADLQLDEFTGPERIRPLLQAVNNTDPDVILAAGDLVTTGQDYFPEAGAALSFLHAQDGIYAVLGDHDFWSDYDTSVETLRHAGAAFEWNALTYLPIGTDTLNLFLVSNSMPDRITAPLLDSLLTLPRRTGPSILLVHDAQDRIVDAAAAHNIDLVIGGHTHGSQIAIDFFGYNLTRLLMNSAHISGRYTHGRTTVYICNGIGMSVAPIRYNATPSFGIITLTRK